MSILRKNYNGITRKTVKNLQLGAGAFFKNLTAEETYAEAKAALKTISASRGGGTFRAAKLFEQVEIDGAGGRVKGGIIFRGWEVSLSSTFIEITPDTIILGLGAAETDTTTIQGSTIITGKMNVDDSDFVSVGFMGCIAGSEDPIKIIVDNAFNEQDFELTTSDDGTGTIAMQFFGYNDLDEYMDDDVSAPFKIIYPSMAA